MPVETRQWAYPRQNAGRKSFSNYEGDCPAPASTLFAIWTGLRRPTKVILEHRGLTRIWPQHLRAAPHLGPAPKRPPPPPTKKRKGKKNQQTTFSPWLLALTAWAVDRSPTLAKPKIPGLPNLPGRRRIIPTGNGGNQEGSVGACCLFPPAEQVVSGKSQPWVAKSRSWCGRINYHIIDLSAPYFFKGAPQGVF